MKRDHELHDRRRGRNIGVLILLLAFVMLLFFVTMVKMAPNGAIGNPSAEQGGDWGTAFIEWIKE